VLPQVQIQLSVLALDPGSEPPGMTHKMIIDATTPAPPEKHGEYTMQVRDPLEAKDWLPKLQALLKKA
jgi:4-hydroxybenzoate decarboxylase